MEQLAMFGAATAGRMNARGQEPAPVYEAAVALRERGFVVRRAGWLHDVDGDLLGDSGLLRLAAYWRERIGRSRAAVERDYDREHRAIVWGARLAKWAAREPLPRGANDRRPVR